MRARKLARRHNLARMPKQDAQPEQPTPDVEGSPENPFPVHSGDYFLWEMVRVEDRIRKGDGKLVDHKREIGIWHELAAAHGVDLTRHSLSKLDPIRRLLQDPNLPGYQEKELVAMRDSIREAEALDAKEEAVKKKWLSLIDLTIDLQRKARQSLPLFAIYVLRCQQTGKVLWMQPIHMTFFREWTHPTDLNSEILAPPGVGKTTCLYALELWEIGENPKLRFLKQCCDVGTAEKRVAVIRRHLDEPRYRAIFPDVRVDPTRKDNSGQFTVIGANPTSQDPTMQAAGAGTEFQGAGFDRIHADDLCGQRVRHERSTRERVTSRFKGTTLTRRRFSEGAECRVRYIATPWHVDDTTSRMRRDIDNGHMPGWRVKVFRVEEAEDGTPIPCTNQPGQVVDLKILRATQPDIYACCHRMDPKDQSLRKLRKLIYYDASGGTSPLCPPTRRDFYRKRLEDIHKAEQWQVLDPAGGGKNSTGMVGFAISRKDKQARAAITTARFFQNTPDDVIQHVCDAVQSEGAEHVLIEMQGGMKGQASTWGNYLIARLGEDYRGRIEYSGTRMRDRAGRPVGQNLSKTDRYYSAIPYMVGGAVLFPGKWESCGGSAVQLVCVDDPALRELHDQLLNYPNCSSDDGLDCVSMFINWHCYRLVKSVEALRKEAGPSVSTGPIGVNVLSVIYAAQQAKRKTPPIEYGARWDEAAMFAA